MSDKYITNLISKMTLDEKVGAILTLGFAGTVPRAHIYESIVKYHCGGLRLTPHARLFGSYVDPNTGKSVVDVVDTKGYKKGVNPPTATAEEYREILSELQEVAMNRPHGIPLHFAFDQEGGTSADFSFDGVKLFTKPMGITATGDPQLAYDVALAVSRQSRAVGFNWLHSPVLDVNSEPDNPEIYTRSYSDDAVVVAEYALKACQGYKDGGLIATGKHFPGRGHSAVDAHFKVSVIDVDEDTLMKRELLPYKVLIENNALPSIMIAHSIFPAIDPDNIATVSKKVITGLLRDKLGFDGVITTDSMTMGGIAVRYGVANACALAVEAGADLVLMKAENNLVAETVEAIKELVTSGRMSEGELNKKVYRVLKLKYDYGLFKYGSLWHETPAQAMNDPQIAKLSKLVARRSTLVLRQRDGVLPVSETEPMLVIEQINKTPNNIQWHPGIFYKHCLKYNMAAEYLETSYHFDDEDKEAILKSCKKFDTVVITNFYIRGNLANNEFIEKLIKENPQKKFIIVTNTPYRLSIPENAENIILTFATSPDNIEVAAGTLFGRIKPQGEYPISYKL